MGSLIYNNASYLMNSPYVLWYKVQHFPPKCIGEEAAQDENTPKV